MYTFTQLRCFLAVVDEMNFRRAAARLNMSQPPLSRQIRMLEEEIGAQLFDRSGRASKLSPAGQSFAESARRMLEVAEYAALDARRIASGAAGSLTIGFTASSSYVYLPRLMTFLRAQAPALSLNLREMTTPQQAAALQSSQIDFALLRPPVSLSGVQAMRVFREKLLLALPLDHPLASRAEVSLRHLAGETLITYPPVEGPYFHNRIVALLNMAGVTPARVQHITQAHSMLALVGAGLGVALLPQSVMRFALSDVVLRPVMETEGVNAELMLAWRTRTRNRACDTLLDLLAQAPPTSPVNLDFDGNPLRGAQEVPVEA